MIIQTPRRENLGTWHFTPARDAENGSSSEPNIPVEKLKIQK
jgi:hypothetical protein